MEKDVNDIASKLIEINVQLKFFHWQTKSYARHQAYGRAYATMGGLIDNFVEILMGKYGTVPAKPIKIYNRNEKDIQSFIDETVSFLMSFSTILNPQADSDLLNIRDEMISEFNKLKYLITLK
jgi:hypothetical protein